MKKALLILLSCFLRCWYSEAQPLHGLDLSFANNGIYIGDTGVYGHIGVQTDGRILVTGRERRNGIDENVKRLNSNGTVDVSFANNGFFTMQFPNGKPGGFNAIAFQPDGKIILAGGGDTGITNGDFLLARLKPDGSFDSSFGGGGYVITRLAGEEYVTSVALQPDGKVIAYGESYYNEELLVVRYNASGMVDSSFGNNGIVSSNANWGLSDAQANDVAITIDGKIVLGAKADINALGGAAAFTAIRLLPDGNLDTSFNHTGIVYTNKSLGWLLYCKAMRLQHDGKVLLAGYDDSLAVVRFDTTGQLDNNFGNGGITKIAGGNHVRNATMHLQADNKILVSAQIDAANYLYRRNPIGTPDTSFGVNGELICYGLSINSIITSQDSKILLAGMLNRKTAIVRLIPTPTSISDINTNNVIDICPNPVSDYINLRCSAPQKIQKASLYSSDGKLRLTQTHPYTDKIATAGLADGIYYLTLSLSNHQQVTKKIIIQKQ
jgi:uncharacterized delta-60 repeat protein